MHLIRTGRRMLAILVVVSMLAIGSSAGATDRDVHIDPGAESTSPVTFDLLVLRPAGIVGFFTGAALFLVPVMPLTLITRPQDMGKPFEVMVVRPARYVVADPLGGH